MLMMTGVGEGLGVCIESVQPPDDSELGGGTPLLAEDDTPLLAEDDTPLLSED